MSGKVWPCPGCGENVMLLPCQRCGYSEAEAGFDNERTPFEEWEAEQQARDDERAYWDFVGDVNFERGKR